MNEPGILLKWPELCSGFLVDLNSRKLQLTIISSRALYRINFSLILIPVFLQLNINKTRAICYTFQYFNETLKLKTRHVITVTLSLLIAELRRNLTRSNETRFPRVVIFFTSVSSQMSRESIFWRHKWPWRCRLSCSARGFPINCRTLRCDSNVVPLHAPFNLCQSRGVRVTSFFRRTYLAVGIGVSITDNNACCGGNWPRHTTKRSIELCDTSAFFPPLSELSCGTIWSP